MSVMKHGRQGDFKEDVGLAKHRQRYAEWLAVRSQISGNGALKDAAILEALNRASELALLICTTPAVLRWCVNDKLEVLRQSLTQGCTAGQRYDNRDLALLAGIEADIYRMTGDE